MATSTTSSASLPLSGWLDAMPHPELACEIAPTHVGAMRGPQHAAEPLLPGVVNPSTVELNIADASAVRERLQKVLSRIGAHSEDAALLVPDQVVRVFLLHFDSFPRDAEEAVPLLRWRLKKSVPFDVEDTVVSYMRQPAPPSVTSGVEMLAAVARRNVIRQYEEIAEACGLRPGVVLSSTLAAISFLDGARATLLARMSGHTLTTVIVRGDALCVYRCTEMPAAADALEPQALMDEVFPAVAFYQDTWRENVQQARLSGFGGRFDEFRRAVEAELGGSVSPLVNAAAMPSGAGDARAIAEKQLDALAGWGLRA